VDNFNQQEMRPESTPRLKSIEGRQQLDLHFAHEKARQPKSRNSRSRGEFGGFNNRRWAGGSPYRSGDTSNQYNLEIRNLH
jgi:hypothetical protein